MQLSLSCPSCPGSGWGPASAGLLGFRDLQDMRPYKTGVLHDRWSRWSQPCSQAWPPLQLELSECLVPGQTGPAPLQAFLMCLILHSLIIQNQCELGLGTDSA